MITSSRKCSRKRLSSGSSPPQQQSPQHQQQSPHLLDHLRRQRKTSLLRSQKSLQRRRGSLPKAPPTAHRRAERLGSLGRQRRPKSLKGSSSRMSQPQPKSPPLFAVDWSRFTCREAFLAKTSEVCKLDPNSAEGFNCHVTSYYHVSSDWGVSHPNRIAPSC